MDGGRTRAGVEAAGSWQRWLTAAMASALAAGCVSIRPDKATTPAARVGSGAVEVRVFETVSDQQHRAPTRRQVRTELCVAEGSECRPVHRSFAPGWGVTDLAPGRYRLTVAEWVDAKGESHRFSSPGTFQFDLAEGASVGIAVILRSGTQALANTGMAVVGILGCAALESIAIPCGF